MSKAQVQELMLKIDPHNKGYISYLDFLDKFESRETDVSLGGTGQRVLLFVCLFSGFAKTKLLLASQQDHKA